MATTLNAATFMGKNFSTIQSVVKNHESLTLKQIFDVTAQMVLNEEEINGLDKNSVSEEFLDKNCHWLMIQWSSIFKAQRSTYSQILCFVSAKFFNIMNATKRGRTELQEYEPREATEIFEDVSGEPTEFEWNIFPGFTSLQLCDKISDLLSSVGQTPESFTGRILFISMFNDISCDRYDNKDECLKNAEFVKTFAKRFGVGQWSFIGPGSEKKVVSFWE